MASSGFLLSLPCSTLEPSDPLVVQAKVALGDPQFNHDSIGLERNGVRAKDRVPSELMVQQGRDRMATKLP